MRRIEWLVCLALCATDRAVRGIQVSSELMLIDNPVIHPYRIAFLVVSLENS